MSAAGSALTIAGGRQSGAYVRTESRSGHTLTAEVMTRNMLARDAEEGIDAFLEKRPAVWTGT